MSDSCRHRSPETDRVDETDTLRAIGAVADDVGLTPRAIRYYEEIGLLRPAVRIKGRSRLFDASDVERLREIKRMREVIGFSLAEIAEFLDTEAVREHLRTQFQHAVDPRARARVLREALALAERRLAIVDHKLAQVQTAREDELQHLTRLRQALAKEAHDARANQYDGSS